MDGALQLDDPSEYIDYIKPFQNIRKDKVSTVDIFYVFFTPAASVADLDPGSRKCNIAVEKGKWLPKKFYLKMFYLELEASLQHASSLRISKEKYR